MFRGPAHASSLPWHRRMTTRVAVGISLLVALSIGAIVLATTRAVTSRSLSRAAEDLDIARATFNQSLEARAQAASALTRLVTALPLFRAYLTDTRLLSDSATMNAMVDGYRSQLEAQFCIVTDARRRWLADPGWSDTDSPEPSLLANIEHASTGESRRSVVAVHNRLFLVVSEPAQFAEETLGTMTVGYALDDTVAKTLARLTRCEVTLVSGARVCATSLTGAVREELSLRLAQGRHAAADEATVAQVQQIGEHRYVGGTFSLSLDHADANGSRLVLLQDWRPTQDFIDELLRQFLGAAVVVFGFALAGGLLFSQHLTRPLREIAAAAKDITEGNLSQRLPVRGNSEAATVAIAFNEMSSSVRVARERLLHDAIHDVLTELPNRVLFMERVQRSIRRRYRHPEYTFAVLFVDLDRFQAINDSLGRPAGDQLLVEVARRLADIVRSDDVVARSKPAGLERESDTALARLGGDEFTILLEDLRDPSDAVRIAERVHAAIVQPVSLKGRSVHHGQRRHRHRRAHAPHR